jgi:hypothetical protein
MGTMKQPEVQGCGGEPLAVCINDCQLDYGQASSELIRVCFQVRCAFAELRWGRLKAAASESVKPSKAEHEQPAPPQ